MPLQDNIKLENWQDILKIWQGNRI